MRKNQLILTVEDFSFSECLRYLGRNEEECTHLVEKETLYKLVDLEHKPVLLQISARDHQLLVQTDVDLSLDQFVELKNFINRYFDLNRDLMPFYAQMQDDPIVAPLAERFRGLRLVRMSDFFEAICWSILGQQINLNFAYRLKRQFVECYGQRIQYQVGGEERQLFRFPQPEIVAALSIDELKAIQFSRQKADYIIGVARHITSGELEVENLYTLSPEDLKRKLIALRGIGNWTANYLLMKVFGNTTAFPIEDVGLHNAVRLAMNREDKPTIPELRAMAQRWTGWEAYATFYLWHSLLE